MRAAGSRSRRDKESSARGSPVRVYANLARQPGENGHRMKTSYQGVEICGGLDLMRNAIVAVCGDRAGRFGFRGDAGAQTGAQKPFEPYSGQPGKDVVWVPTPQPLVDKMLDMAKVTPQDFVMDLGSGDGRTVITAAKRGATRARHRVQPGHGRRCRAQRAAGERRRRQGDVHRRPTCSRPTSRRRRSSRCSCCRRST